MASTPLAGAPDGNLDAATDTAVDAVPSEIATETHAAGEIPSRTPPAFYVAPIPHEASHLPAHESWLDAISGGDELLCRLNAAC